MHPLTPDLSGLSLDELYKKQTDLNNKLMFSYRSGQTDIIHQLQLVLEDYKLEIEKRNREMLEKNTQFKDKIDITK